MTASRWWWEANIPHPGRTVRVRVTFSRDHRLAVTLAQHRQPPWCGTCYRAKCVWCAPQTKGVEHLLLCQHYAQIRLTSNYAQIMPSIRNTSLNIATLFCNAFVPLWQLSLKQGRYSKCMTCMRAHQQWIVKSTKHDCINWIEHWPSLQNML